MGKSSLLKAGLFPLLRKDGFLPVWIRLDHSGRCTIDEQILHYLREEMARADLEVEELNPPLVPEGGEGAWDYLHRIVLWDDRNRPVEPVLVFDQFEEAFTIGRERAGSDTLVEVLACLVENYVPAAIKERVRSEL